MKWWPWQTEKRATESAAEDSDRLRKALTQALLAARGNEGAMGLGALEASAGAWARAFASADISPSTPITRLLTPRVLAEIGRGLILRGESIHWLEAGPDGAYLAQARQWDVHGRGANPMGWTYTLYLQAPTGTLRRRIGAGDVLHCRYATREGVPYIGVSPLASAQATRELADRLEASLTKEFKMPTGMAVFGAGGIGMRGPEENDAGWAGFSQGLVDAAKGADGLIVMGERKRVEDDDDAILTDPWDLPNTPPVTERIGPNPPSTIHELRSNVAATVYAACGIPPNLLSGGSAGAAREAWRQFLHGAVSPVAALVAEELRLKLESPSLEFGFDALFASDITGRARAFGSLVQGGMAADRAERITGLAA